MTDPDKVDIHRLPPAVDGAEEEHVMHALTWVNHSIDYLYMDQTRLHFLKCFFQVDEEEHFTEQTQQTEVMCSSNPCARLVWSKSLLPLSLV